MSAERETRVIIEATPVTFPFPPYKQQIEYMSVLLQAMKRGVNAQLEAATGFGKTACVFSAFIGFKQQYALALRALKVISEGPSGGISLTQIAQTLGMKSQNVQVLMSFIEQTYPLG